jgi:hypothetical protein
MKTIEQFGCHLWLSQTIESSQDISIWWPICWNNLCYIVCGLTSGEQHFGDQWLYYRIRVSFR